MDLYATLKGSVYSYYKRLEVQVACMPLFYLIDSIPLGNYFTAGAKNLIMGVECQKKIEKLRIKSLQKGVKSRKPAQKNRRKSQNHEP